MLLRSVGFEPGRLRPRQQDILIARMVPFVLRNYNAVELGPRGTGKSHLFQQISPYAHLVSGGKATIANMFVNMNTARRGLVAVSGTPPYQPPDADLTRWDVSTDLFAVGVTLYELLCDGQHPYPHATPLLDTEPRDPRQFRKDLDEGLAEFLLRACAPNAVTDSRPQPR